MIQHFFLDLPVYRLSEKEFFAEGDRLTKHHIQSVWKGFSDEENQVGKVGFDQHHYRLYGDCQFNEIVGHIKLFFYGTQIRGEYYSSEKKRCVLGRRRVFKRISAKMSYEENLKEPFTSESIFAAIQVYLDRCEAELHKGRLIDRSALVKLGSHIDWAELFTQFNTKGFRA